MATCPRRILVAILVLCSSTSVSADDWHNVTIPDAWRKVPTGQLAPVDGFSWYRCTVRPPANWNGDQLTLYVEALDDARAIYVNGQQVGVIGTFPPVYRSGLGATREYPLADDAVVPGQQNSIAIRAYQNDPRPNFSVAPPVLLNTTRRQAIRLKGTWQYRPGDDPTWAQAETPSGAGVLFDTVDAVRDMKSYVTERNGDQPALSPADSQSAFQLADDLKIERVLSEPQIAQPLFMTWDPAGRLWVMEYRQYPEIAGVEMVSRDVYLRSVYDSVPDPPPHGPKGRDRISIHEDTTGDGVLNSHRVFVDGLNLATSFAIGHGGVFVANPPYLLFYPDSDEDGVPDRDPDVLLEGFGLEDSHSVINSIRFGPDGWLYGAQGSTVTAAVKRPGSREEPVRTMGQQIWRYHPKTARFEVFAEGGGNTFGVEFNAEGHLFSGHNGGDTRGFHYVQGGYYQKGFGKHGPLSNPYAFGYFPAMKHHSVPRFTHTFVIYEDTALPAKYHGKLFGIEPLQGQIVLSDIRPHLSSFQTEDIDRVVQTDDPWFRPVDIKVGPDGAIYIADFHEQRIDHSSHYAGRIDRSSGRIWRVSGRTAPALKGINWSDVSTTELIAKLSHPAKSQRQAIQQQLRNRRDSSVVPVLKQRLTNGRNDSYALDHLWALHASGGLDQATAERLLRHPDERVRIWTIRLLCEEPIMSSRLATAVIEVAGNETDVGVRKQLASSARRLTADQALPILNHLFRFDDDSDDIHQPLLLWWALEAHVDTAHRNIVSQLFENETVWNNRLVQEHLAERLIKRLAMSDIRDQLLSAASLLSSAPDPATKERLLEAFESAFTGRSLAELPDELVSAMTAAGGGSPALKLRQGNKQAIVDAVRIVSDRSADMNQRMEFVQIFGQLSRPEFLPPLLNIVAHEPDGVLLATALNALQSYTDPNIAGAVIKRLPALTDPALAAAQSLLASRVTWSLATLQKIDDGSLAPQLLSDACVRMMLNHPRDDIARLIRRHWKTLADRDSEQTQTVSRLTRLLSVGSGNPKAGKLLYRKNCGRCHTLFREGGHIGPDLTSYQRNDLNRLLTSIVSPSSEIREGFENNVVVTEDGRVLSGFLVDRDDHVIILRGVDGQNSVLKRSDIEQMTLSRRSIMPSGILEKLSESELRDLFAYLRSSQPVNY